MVRGGRRHAALVPEVASVRAVSFSAYFQIELTGRRVLQVRPVGSLVRQLSE